jgi:hypothetical protein
MFFSFNTDNDLRRLDTRERNHLNRHSFRTKWDTEILNLPTQFITDEPINQPPLPVCCQQQKFAGIQRIPTCSTTLSFLAFSSTSALNLAMEKIKRSYRFHSRHRFINLQEIPVFAFLWALRFPFGVSQFFNLLSEAKSLSKTLQK